MRLSKKSVLLLILTLLLLLNAVFVVIYFQRTASQRDFDQSPSSDIKISGGTNVSLKIATVNGTTEGKAIKDQQTGEYEIGIKFSTTNVKNIHSVLVLGKGEEQAQVYLAKLSTDWVNKSLPENILIEDLSHMLQREQHIIVTLYIEDPLRLKTNPECKIDCQERMKKIDQYYRNNLILIKQLSNQYDKKGVLQIGGPLRITIFEK